MRGFFLISFVLFSISICRAQLNTMYWTSQKYTDLIEKMKDIGCSEKEIASLFSSSEFYPGIYKKFEASRKKTARNPYLKFLTEESVREGRKFLRENLGLLNKIEESYGVSKEVITALWRVESCFGKNKGSYQAFGVFNSIIFYGEKKDSAKIEWAKEEMIALLKLCKVIGKDPLKVKGSWAGALGIPQFMPTSYLEFAVDGDGDGRIDLFNSQEDAVYSAANYLLKHNWKKDSVEAVYCYNHSKRFVNCIFQYAKKLKSQLIF